VFTAVQWFPEPGRTRGSDAYGVEYEEVDGSRLTALRISKGKRYRMRPGDWILAGGKYLRRVTMREMAKVYVMKPIAHGKFAVELKPGKGHPWLVKRAPARLGMVGKLSDFE
jgi:hypothetical protein